MYVLVLQNSTEEHYVYAHLKMKLGGHEDVFCDTTTAKCK